MSNTLKITALLIAMLGILPTSASFRVTIPLEVEKGGHLSNNTINFGAIKDTNGSEPQTINCVYNSSNLVQELNSPIGNYQAGDIVYVYNSRVLGFDSPSNGMTHPNGVSKGKKQTTDFENGTTDYEICFNSSWVPPTENPNQPIDPDNSDWTPECILNTSTDYAAINTTNGKREFHSTTFGLNHLTASGWIYTPEDYDPNRAGSYKYYDNSEQTGDERVSGPNPDFSYSEICRVRKRD